MPKYMSARPIGAALLTLAAMSMSGSSSVSAKSYTETVLHSFDKSDGWGPTGMVRNSKGRFYGTTSAGGAHGEGTLFELTPSGNVNTLWDFSGGADGSNPGAAPLLAGNMLFGTTNGGGATGKGVIYAFDLKTKQLSTLFNFDWSYGVYPQSTLIRDASGNLYGVTAHGGAYQGQCDGDQGCGVVFELSSSGTYTILYSFTGVSDGVAPIGGLIMDAAGNLYGTTQGGFVNGSNDYGSVFEVSPTGQETTLYNFPSTGPHQPMAALTMDAAGNLYGTAFDGGGTGCPNTAGCGGLFEIDASGNFSVLYQFEGGSDGASPVAALLYKNGKLIGTTNGNGYGYGSAFEFDLAKNKLNVLYDFSNQDDGWDPGPGVLIDSSGNLYGGTGYGGTGNCSPYPGCGTIYEISPAAK